MKNYKELYEAVKSENTIENRIELFNWLDENDNSWNGERYLLHDGDEVRPVYKGIGEPDEDGDFEHYELIDVEIR